MKNETEAARWYRLSAEQGNLHAQYFLGVMYASGRGVPKDSAEAVRWYRKSAEQEAPGSARSRYALAMCYANGEGVPKNEGEAVRMFRQAASEGIAEAQDELAKRGLSW